MNHNDFQPVPTPLPVTRNSLIWSWTSFGISVITFLGAYISNLAGNTDLMIVFAVLCTATMTFGAVLHVIRYALHSAPQSQAVADGNSVRSVVIWKTLWLIPALLEFFGLLRCIRGVTPDGIAIGAVGLLTLIPIIPTYIVLGIMRLVRKKR
ncbi:hypothetical protein [Arthrobacter sp. P2b]|jgi:hypothetical protein|uniref:hypothetical protein n=1 Tax=Arthrobacter sp. P2b TaxID=1938741 RepID=UPI0009A76F8F|nr:hypothetical protein [Arthrobacter sp. P2b]SLJ96135.1 hypothetical protein SAMN06272721_1029 [Arthrobacter sp. P2b]